MTNTADRLLKFLVETDSGCWEFVGGRFSDGYGAIRNIKHGKAWSWLQ
jgi:hypothetical protein